MGIPMFTTPKNPNAGIYLKPKIFFSIGLEPTTSCP